MYHHSDDYNKIAMLAIDIYLDYNITAFPINADDVCQQLGIALLPYSNFCDSTQAILRRCSPDAFYVPATKASPFCIFYEDDVSRISSVSRMRYSIFHEIKHYVNNDTVENDYDEDMADYFAKYMMCPIPFLIAKNINDKFTIISKFEVSDAVATNIVSNIANRKNSHGNRIFDYEKPLLRHLLGDNYEDMT